MINNLLLNDEKYILKHPLQIILPCLRTDALGEVKLALAVEAQDVLKYPGRSVEVELPTHQTERVTKAENFG